MNISNLKHLSFSNLNLFETCPRCWYLKYVLGYEMPGSDAMDFGSEVHRAIENYHKTGALPVVKKDGTGGYLRAMIQAYTDVFKKEDYDTIEEFWEVPIEHPEQKGVFLDLPLVVRIDRVWNGVIRDVKTSASRYQQSRVDGAYQTTLYAYAYRQKFQKEENGIAYDVLVKNKVPKLQILDTFATDESIKDALWWIWNTFETIKNYPEPSNHSKRCWNKGLLP